MKHREKFSRESTELAVLPIRCEASLPNHADLHLCVNITQNVALLCAAEVFCEVHDLHVYNRLRNPCRYL